MNEFKYVKVKADTPYERGKQYGLQTKEEIARGVDFYKNLFKKTTSDPWEKIKEYAFSFVSLIEREMPEILEEAKGIAEGAGIDFAELMVLNCRYEITKFTAQVNECTTAAVLPEASRNGKTYLIKNWDYRPEIQENIVILHVEEPDGTRIIGLTEAGQMLREGFNSHGIGLCNNQITSINDTKGIGVPVTFLRRKVLTSKTFEEAKSILVNAPRTVSNNMMLVSGTGKAIDIEAHPLGSNYIKPILGIITHANHFVTDPDLDAKKGIDKRRDTRLRYLLERKYSRIDLEYIQDCMKDHAYYPLSICRHEGTLATVASLIIDFDDQTAYICKGKPCAGGYKAYKL